MDIKDKLIGSEAEKEFPDDFKENTEQIKKSEDLEIADFIKRKKSEDKAKEEAKAPKQVQAPQAPIEEPKPPEPKKPLADIIPTAAPAPQEEIQPVENEKISNLAKILTIYMTPQNVEATKQALQGAVNGKYNVAMQAGIQVTKENVEEVSSILKYLADKGYLVVVSGEHVETIFHEPTK